MLSEEERAVRDSVRRFVDEQVLPVIGQLLCGWALSPRNCSGDGRGLRRIWCQPAGGSTVARGLTTWPTGSSCRSLLSAAIRGCVHSASVQGALAMYPIYAFGSEAQKRQYVPKMAAGEIIGCFGLTEPDYGSNPSGMITMARRQKDGSWLLNGAKMWITNGSTAQIAVVWAKTQWRCHRRFNSRLHRAQRHPRIYGEGSGRGSFRFGPVIPASLVFQDVHLDANAVLPNSGGLKSPLMCLTQARYGIAWGALGAAMACYEEAVAYAKNRVMFDRPIAGFQIQQQRLADMLTEIVKAQLVALHLGRLKDAGTYTPAQVSLAKRNNVSIATDIAREARRLAWSQWHSC